LVPIPGGPDRLGESHLALTVPHLGAEVRDPVLDLARCGRVEPVPESALASMAEAIRAFEHLATHGLHQVRARLAASQQLAGATIDETAQRLQMALEQGIDDLGLGRRARDLQQRLAHLVRPPGAGPAIEEVVASRA